MTVTNICHEVILRSREVTDRPEHALVTNLFVANIRRLHQHHDFTNIIFAKSIYLYQLNPDCKMFYRIGIPIFRGVEVMSQSYISPYFPLQSVQIFDVDHVINRKMMKLVRRWMNRNFVFFENFGFTLFGYRWFASRLQFDFQKLYKNFKIFNFFKNHNFMPARTITRIFHHHHPLLYHFPPPLNFHGQNGDGARELKTENVGDDQLMTVIQWF